ncbi:pickpocket protein 11 [Drosophila teissieri]|uniref:pickpocket protein 11 n=1 Tax=Drosophila teissieri TaxID=7243 RepID=UPI001CB9EAA1|nr:pickpocket protein 11 [Drosophila teissieri]
MSDVPVEDSPTRFYLVNFEDYLRPKQPSKCQPLQRFEKPNGRSTNLYRNLNRLKIIRWYNSASKRFEQLPLPKFLGFLRARNDDGLCMRKTGFEIYCEMASIHGFHIFVGARTWQRILWWLLICNAVLLSFILVIMSLSMSKETPTIRFIDTMMKPTAKVPFPAVTICGFNTISMERLQNKEWVTATLIEQVSKRNASWLELLEDSALPICPQIRSCQWDNRMVNCLDKLQPIWTLDQRLCCTFNYNQQLFSSHLGVSFVLRSKDTELQSSKSAGYEVLIHESHEMPNGATPRLLVPNGSDNHIMLRPFVNRFTTNLEGLSSQKRVCYFPKERRLISSDVYNQINCQAECRSENTLKSCGCVPPKLPVEKSWLICDLKQMQCVIDFDHDEIISGEQKNCDCLPPCEFNRYEFQSDIRLIKGIISNTRSIVGTSNHERANEVRVRVYYDSAIAEELLLDVYENWMTFIGTFGGITGLFMGCSFVSVFELVFFSCVRPTCNWLTRKQILWRRRRNQRVGNAEARSLGRAN